ncbi:MAG: DedA family protein [Betaproteobacteria bacterium]|nr:DedA family protein [Betaproteobacteria bacterium]
MFSTLIYSLFALDQTLTSLVGQNAWLIYLVMFAVIFAETGLIVFPFLPGDSILFIAGTIAAASGVNVHLLALTLVIAAVAGDSVNYAVGHYLGPKVFHRPDSRWLRQEHLLHTQRFYDKYGGFTIIIGRFVPIVRTFAPFLAGVAQMSYSRFLAYNIVGGLVWVSSLLYAGYLFGNVPWVKSNLSLIVVGIVVVSFLPLAVRIWREHRARRSA